MARSLPPLLPREGRQHGAFGLRQITLELSRGGLGLSGLQLGQNRGIHLDIGGVEPLWIGQKAKGQTQLCGEVSEEGRKPRAIGQIHNRAMKIHIGIADRAPVMGLLRGAGARHRRRQSRT